MAHKVMALTHGADARRRAKTRAETRRDATFGRFLSSHDASKCIMRGLKYKNRFLAALKSKQ